MFNDGAWDGPMSINIPFHPPWFLLGERTERGKEFTDSNIQTLVSSAESCKSSLRILVRFGQYRELCYLVKNHV